ncbi:MAG: hypothetical protein K0S71_499 [Clostridia bacterium]|jgi:hypothetical protein|nr:hypothetical protein [Clostridia bacterium]
MSHHAEQLTVGLSYSYISYIDEYLTLLNNSLYSSIGYLDTETLTITEDLKSIFLALPDMISENLDQKEASAVKIIGFRDTLEKKYRALHAYQRELHHLMTSFNMNHTDLDAPEITEIDFEQLASDCVHFVFEKPQIKIRQERASLLLPYIPIRITKENYLHYLEKSIEQIAIENTSESAALLVSILEQLFDGHLCPDYGRHFKDLAVTLEELTLSAANEDFYENTELLGETIDSLLKIVHNLYKMIGCLSNLLLFDDLDFKALTSLHISFHDLYHSVKSIIISDEDRELFLSTLPDKVQEIKDHLQTNFEKVCKSSDLDPSFSLMQTYLSIDVDHIFGFNIQKNIQGTQEFSSVFDHFLSTLKERLLNLSNSDRKLRMQYLISTVPFVMSEKTFNTYIKQAFSTLSNQGQNLVAAMYLINILEENEFFIGEEVSQQVNSADSHEHHSLNHDHTHHDCNCEDHKH